MEGPDHKASLEPQELADMVRKIRNVEQALGDGIKQPNVSERSISKVVLKSILAKCDIKKGEILTENKLVVKRADSGISARYWDLVVGSTALCDYREDDPIRMA